MINLESEKARMKEILDNMSMKELDDMFERAGVTDEMSKYELKQKYDNYLSNMVCNGYNVTPYENSRTDYLLDELKSQEIINEQLIQRAIESTKNRIHYISSHTECSESELHIEKSARQLEVQNYILELIEKEIPKKVILKKNYNYKWNITDGLIGLTPVHDSRIDEHYCQACKKSITREFQNRCDCGQVFDFNEESEEMEN